MYRRINRPLCVIVHASATLNETLFGTSIGAIWRWKVMVSTRTSYEYDEKECDISDEGALKEFRVKRLEWVSWLKEGDNSIWRQIHAMIWSDRLFWMINESRKISIEQGGEFAARSGWLGEMIDQGYYATQLLALRKIMEPASKDPRRQVVSLRRLLDDLKVHRHLFTRENYVCYDGLRFDPKEAERIYWAENAPVTGVSSEAIGGPADSAMSERTHCDFDALSDGIGPSRDRFERIREEVFDNLVARLKAAPFDKVRVLANKKIAHAPDETSIPKKGLPKLTFQELWECQQAICEVAGFISSIVIQEGNHGIVPIPQLDMFDRWDKPFIPAGAEIELRKIWDDTSKERETWGSENVSQILKDMRMKSGVTAS